MFGLGVLRGMMVTLKHFVETYTEDPKRAAAQRQTPDAVHQMPNASRGLFTVEYPEKKLAIPERFRFYPMLIVDGETGQDWCTSCGICAKVCPPQCIWIVRGTKPDGKPKPEPEEFYIDTTICMQCGYCAEFCPFDAIKMNHDYELSSYERHESAIYTKDMLSVTTTYYARTHPRAWAEESAARAAKETKKEKATAETAAPAAPAAPKTPVPATPAGQPTPATLPSGKPKPMSAKAAKLARQQAEAGGQPPIENPPVEASAATAPAAPSTPTPPVEGQAAPAGEKAHGRVPARLAKQMREQAAAGGEAPTTDATASAPPPAAPAPPTPAAPTTPTEGQAAPAGDKAHGRIPARLAKQMREQAAAAAASGAAVAAAGATEKAAEATPEPPTLEVAAPPTEAVEPPTAAVSLAPPGEIKPLPIDALPVDEPHLLVPAENLPPVEIPKIESELEEGHVATIGGLGVSAERNEELTGPIDEPDGASEERSDTPDDTR